MALRHSIFAATMIAVCPMASQAQQPASYDPILRVMACRDIPDDTARLACFDRVANALKDAQRSGDLLVVDRKAVVARRQRAFGLPAANSLAAADVRGAEVKQLTSVVRGSSPTPTPGRYQFSLADGSIWEMLDPAPPPPTGETVTVTAVRLGGFRLKIGRRTAIMVKRVR